MILRRFLDFFLRHESVIRGHFAVREDRIDPRTEVIPMMGGDMAKTYYEVADMWAGERLRVRRMLLEAIDGMRGIEDLLHTPHAHQCALGLWLRFADPGEDGRQTIEDLRIWHEQWHAATLLIIEEIASGHLLDARRALMERVGPWNYARRKIDRLLESLWTADHAAAPVSDEQRAFQ